MSVGNTSRFWSAYGKHVSSSYIAVHPYHAQRRSGSSVYSCILDSERLCVGVQILQGHANAVSYVRFLKHQLVTSSIDGTLGWWDVGSSGGSNSDFTSPGADSSPARRLRTMQGHANSRNFVGLSVREHDNLIACGSEQGQAYAYHTSWNEPVAALPVMSRVDTSADSKQRTNGIMSSSGAVQPPISQLGRGGLVSSGLVTAVAWRPVVSEWNRSATLAAASSTGDLGLLSLEVIECAM